jgi:carbamoylphosphate synthase large subunit
MKKILLTSAGTGSAFAMAEAVINNFKDKLELFLCDINPKELVSAASLTDNFFQAPLITDKDYSTFMVNLILSQNIDYCIPFIDLDISLFVDIYERVNREIQLHISDKQTAEICADKMLSYYWLKENGINTPETFTTDGIDSNANLILKPRIGFGSVVVELNRQNLNTLTSHFDYIAQEICSKPEITIDVFRNIDKNQFFYVCRERIETKLGVCTKAKLFLDEKLGRIAMKIADGLNLRYFCFQVMQLKGRWVVTDINPRLGSGTPMCSVAGIDFFSAAIADMLGEDGMKFLEPLRNEVYVTRQYRNILSK